MTQTENKKVHTELHTWPHIPKIQWERIFDWYISNTNLTTFIFLLIITVISVLANKALKKESSKLKTFFLSFVSFTDTYIRNAFWEDKVFARKYFPLIMWLFIIIFLWNIFWLIIDWIWVSISTDLFHYLRPIHSDLNTTLWLALITVVSFIIIWIKSQGWFSYTKWYLFNFTWKNITEKCVNVFVGWLHFIWIPATLASLSLRLFWNIFAWIILVWVISYLWVLMTSSLFEVWRFLSIPFWFFELFVAFVQAMVFAWLTISYFAQAREEHH